MLALEAHTHVGDLELDIALEAPADGCLALAGPSGAGKTSLLRLVAGLLRPREGRVECGGRVWLDTERGIDLPPERRRCGYVFQDQALFGHLRAWQNVAYPLRELPRRQRRARACELLGRLGMATRAQARPSELSGGERQRVALARALALQPAALLLDEPLSSLDARSRASAARELAHTLESVGVPALLVTHDFAEAAHLGQRVAVIDRGRIAQSGTPAELAAAPGSAFVADFTGAVVLTGVASPGPAGLTRVELDGGGHILSTDAAHGPVAASVFPWEIGLEQVGQSSDDSMRNRLDARVTAVTVLGNRARIGLLAGQPLAAEVTQASAEQLDLRPGLHVTAAWKAAATRLIPG